MLTYAIGFVQNIQLICFAVVFVLMAANDRDNRSLRWLALTYVSGLVGSLLQLAEHLLPAWLSLGLSMASTPIGYACLQSGVICFVHRGRRTRWISLTLICASLPFYVLWSHPAFADRTATLQDFTLSIETLLIAWLLLTTRDPETAWPRRVMGIFYSAYSVVELLRVILYIATGTMPDRAAPHVEIASGIVYVISCSVMPLAFIWMMNARLHAHMGRQTILDPLTQLLNRRGLQEAGDRELARFMRSRHDFAVVLLDIDHFKLLNDSFGHAGGDIVLRGTAALLEHRLRDGDIIGRLGGEEFVLLLPSTSPEEARLLVERLRAALEKRVFQLGDRQTHITSSFGITASQGRHTLTWDTLLNEADIACYAAKHAGRNASRFYHEAAPQLTRATEDSATFQAT